MAIAPNGFRMRQVAGCVETASTYLLSQVEAREIIDHQIQVIESQWNEVCDAARMTESQRKYFWHWQFLNPYALQDYERNSARALSP